MLRIPRPLVACLVAFAVPSMAIFTTATAALPPEPISVALQIGPEGAVISEERGGEKSRNRKIALDELAQVVAQWYRDAAGERGMIDRLSLTISPELSAGELNDALAQLREALHELAERDLSHVRLYIEGADAAEGLPGLGFVDLELKQEKIARLARATVVVHANTIHVDGWRVPAEQLDSVIENLDPQRPIMVRLLVDSTLEVDQLQHVLTSIGKAKDIARLEVFKAEDKASEARRALHPPSRTLHVIGEDVVLRWDGALPVKGTGESLFMSTLWAGSMPGAIVAVVAAPHVADGHIQPVLRAVKELKMIPRVQTLPPIRQESHHQKSR